MHKMLKNPLFCDFLEKPSLDFAETYLFLILEVCSLKRNHFHLVSYFLGSQPILAQCVGSDNSPGARKVYMPTPGGKTT